jgi:hypothetical protein
LVLMLSIVFVYYFVVLLEFVLIDFVLFVVEKLL